MSNSVPTEDHDAINILIGAAIASGSEPDGGPARDSLWPGFQELQARDPALSPPIALTPTLHFCRICQRAYERADHLSRHLKSHENARPFQCRHCPKTFNRADLLNRHVATHERHARSGSSRAEIRRNERAGQACVACAAAKARCENRKPCGRCRARQIPCKTTATQLLYTPQPGPNAENSHDLPEATGSTFRSPIQSRDFSESQATEQTNRVEPLRGRGDLSITNSYPAPSDEYSMFDNDDIQQESVDPLLSSKISYNINSFPMDTDQLHLDAIMNDMIFFPTQVDFNNQNLDFGFNDLDFQEQHLRMSTAVPKYVTIDESANQEKVIEMHRAGRDASRGYAAFVRSPWLWTPAQKDHILSDQDNLAPDEESIPSTLSPIAGLRENPASFVPLCIDAGLRDKMFYLVATMNKYAKGIPNFPSLDLLNYIIGAFFVRQSYQVDTWIHSPTITLEDVLPEFLIALVTAGSSVIAVPTIWKMGLVLQDVVRITVGEMWDRDNSNTRKLQPLQAWMLALDAGLWSGFQRPMELAESFVQPMITMMRRGGMLAAPSDAEACIPSDFDTGKVLEMKWRTWAKRESFKRLSLHLFLHDTRASIALQKSPLISFAEISCSLPISRDLFVAGSATEWKTKYLKQISTSSRRPLPRLIDAIQDIRILSNVDQEIDVSLCYTALLHGFWGQIFAFQESIKFHGDLDVHRLWLAAQQRELYREIENFRDNVLASANQEPALPMTAELFLMMLQVSPEELQRFAGKTGEEAASLALPALERWTGTENARLAIWHAGQVFRWAKAMPPAELRDFYAIAVYFASLTMWTYGHLSNSVLSETSKLSNSSPACILNDPESLETRSFISRDHGKPALKSILSPTRSGGEGEGEVIVLLGENPNAVLELARDLYRSNFPIFEEPLPSLVENMGNLMRDLSSLPETRFSRCASPAEI